MPTAGRDRATDVALKRLRLAVVGGPDVDQRIELMQRLRFRFEPIAVGSNPELASKFAAADFEYHCYPMAQTFNLRSDLRSAVSLRGVFASLRPDVVHCFDTKPAIFGRLAALAARVPVVLATLPGLGGLYAYDTPRVRRRRWVFDRLQSVASELSSWTVFQNRDDRALLVDKGVVPAGRSGVIDGSGVDPKRFRRLDEPTRVALKRELGLEGRPIVLFVGRWIRAKGLIDLVRAIPAVKSRCSNVAFVALGALDRGSDDLNQAEVAAVHREMVCLGSRDDVPSLLSVADVVVLPSRYREGIPRALIEAAMVGVPIVTTDTPGCREVVDRGRAGWLIPANNVDALARALSDSLLRPDEARRRAARAKANALARFTLDSIAGEHEVLYDRLLATLPQR